MCYGKMLLYAEGLLGYDKTLFNYIYYITYEKLKTLLLFFEMKYQASKAMNSYDLYTNNNYAVKFESKKFLVHTSSTNN